MRIMVTGGTGFVGSHSVRAFLAAGHSVRLLVRDAAKVRRVFDPFDLAIPERDVIVGDITDAASVEAAMTGCDGVLHCAALIDLRRSQAQRVHHTNTLGAELIVGGAARRGLPSIVYVSSASVLFRPGLPELHLGLPIADGTTAYARSKADSEHHVRSLQDDGHPIRISYPSGILGPDDPDLTGSNYALYTFFHDMGIVTSGTFQSVDVRDLAALHLRQLELPDGPHRHIAAGPALPWPEFYRVLDELIGHRLRRLTFPGALLRASGIVGDWVKHVWDFDYPMTRDAMEFATHWPGVDAAATTTELGFEFRPPAETFAATLRWLVHAGHLEPRLIGKLADS
ncbi:MAG: NAD-dependent epimerase/dehydratase family protein [Deltaproteobacteria bacterium]|nr:NAD-dependent epimerase/dehydratase family protein [Deltaproteobacteria bacterium]